MLKQICFKMTEHQFFSMPSEAEFETLNLQSEMDCSANCATPTDRMHRKSFCSFSLSVLVPGFKHSVLG